MARKQRRDDPCNKTALVVLFLAWSMFASLLAWDVYVRNHTTLFDPDVLEDIAIKASTLPTPKKKFGNVTIALRKAYPGHVLKNLEWVFVSAGGWTCSVRILSMSVTEYVMLIGTPIEVSGHSGRFWLDKRSTVLHGSYQQWEEGKVLSNVFFPQDTAVHDRFTAVGVGWAANTWVLEYGHGWVPGAVASAIFGTLLNTLDFVTAFKLARICTRTILSELWAGHI